MKYNFLLISIFSAFLVSACEDTLVFYSDESEPCTNGELKCIDQLPSKCVDNHWISSGNPCDENISPCNAGKCTLKDNKCNTEEDKICVGSQPYICNSGTWKTNGSPCPDNRNCINGSCSLDGIYCFEDGLYTCEDDIDEIGTIYQCANSTWTTLKKCPKSASRCDIQNSNSTDGLCK